MKFEKSIYMQESLLPLVLKKLQQKHELNENEPKILFKLLKTFRMLGRLDEASVICKKILGDHENLETQRILSILEGLIPYDDDSLNSSPPPYVHIENLLDADQQELIWDELESQYPKLKAAEVESSKTSLYRRSQVLYSDNLQRIRPWFLKKISEKIEENFARLEQTPYSSFEKEFQLTQSAEGDYFKAHKDAGEGRPGKDSTITRKTTFIYYFFKKPQLFEGGDLLLFDHDQNHSETSRNYTRLQPINNSLMLFPSDRIHMVTPVRMKDIIPMHGRVTLNGWFHKKVI
jgi:Rps23 Pro-64 3,4-dihydroxylase Tpa1-like proline 4-hydroxylase